MSLRAIPECRFLIPIRQDVEVGDGKPHAPRRWRKLERKLRKAFTAFTKAPGLWAGEWTSPKTGKVIRDLSVEYLVAVPKARLHELRSILRQACVEFAQQSIYLSIAGMVEFVEAPS